MMPTRRGTGYRTNVLLLPVSTPRMPRAVRFAPRNDAIRVLDACRAAPDGAGARPRAVLWSDRLGDRHRPARPFVHSASPLTTTARPIRDPASYYLQRRRNPTPLQVICPNHVHR